MAVKFFIRADETEGYHSAKQYHPEQSAQAYVECDFACSIGCTFESREQLNRFLARIGAEDEGDEAYPTSEDREAARQVGSLVGMVTFIRAAGMRMGNGYKIIKVKA